MCVLQQLEVAQSFSEWSDAAAEIDRLNGKNSWKDTAASSDYDYALIERRLKQLRQMRETDDVWSIIFLLRAGGCLAFSFLSFPFLFHDTFNPRRALAQSWGHWKPQAIFLHPRWHKACD